MLANTAQIRSKSLHQAPNREMYAIDTAGLCWTPESRDACGESAQSRSVSGESCDVCDAPPNLAVYPVKSCDVCGVSPAHAVSLMYHVRYVVLRGIS